MEPGTTELYLRSGDKLHLVCFQRVTQRDIDRARANQEEPEVRWSKAEARRSVSVDVADDELSYQMIDSNNPNAPYTVNQRPADEGGDLLHSELVKNDVARVDSGFYRCRLGLGGESSRILVTVVDSASSSLTFAIS